MSSDDALPVEDFVEMLSALPIEKQRAALEWLRSVGAELGCTIEDDPLVSKDFFDFFPDRNPVRSLN